MKYHDNGCFHSVTVSREEVLAFKDTWPCSTLPDKSVWFQFDKRNGDLVDLRPYGMDGGDVLALSHDAQAFVQQFAALRETILAEWNAKQHKRNLFTNISEEQLRRAVYRRLAKATAEAKEVAA